MMAREIDKFVVVSGNMSMFQLIAHTLASYSTYSGSTVAKLSLPIVYHDNYEAD